MGIALPNCIENGVHQLVKVALSSMVGDVKFTMITSITLTIAARLAFSALFGLVLGWGVIGIAIGMSMDLVFLSLIHICFAAALSCAVNRQYSFPSRRTA